MLNLEHQNEEALELVNRAIEHTPTFIELHMAKARILKQLGDLDGAEETYKFGKELDEGDRFLNAKIFKVHDPKRQNRRVRTNDAQMERGHGNQRSQLSQLLEHYLDPRNRKKAHNERGNIREAFRYYNYVDMQLNSQWDDAYDFHTYTVRKYNFRTFTNLESHYTAKLSLTALSLCLDYYRKLMRLQRTRESAQSSIRILKQQRKLQMMMKTPKTHYKR